MKTSFLALLLCAFMLVAVTNKAHATETDMGKIPCKEFSTSSLENKQMMLFWAAGFLSGSNDTTLFNDEWIKVLAGHLNSYCSTNPTAPLISSFDSLPEVDVDGGEDLLKTPCSEIANSTEDLTLTIFWVDGYLSALADNTLMDDEWIEILATHFGTYCKANPKKTVGDAIDALE